MQLQAALGRSPNWVKTTLTALRRRGLVTDGAKTRDPVTGTWRQRSSSRFRRELVIVPGHGHNRRSEPAAGIPPQAPTSQNTADAPGQPRGGNPAAGADQRR